jgi:flagellar L-ring protein precursor FlgH
MSRTSLIVVPLSVLTVLSGCATAPETNIKEPLTARPVAQPVTVVNDGAIYQPQQGVYLFEDRRARRVGDTITVNLVENTQITRKLDNKQNRYGNATVSVPSPTVLGYTNILGATSLSPNSTANKENKTDLTNNSKVTGSMTLTVVDVLANGNLAVAGEKQLALDNDTQYIRLAGVVNPRDIGRDGTVDSSKLADVKFESKGDTSLDRATVFSLLSRFFLTVLPF